MQKTMKAAVVRQFGAPLVIEEVTVPMPGAGQILVKIAATGVCHTDLHAAGETLCAEQQNTGYSVNGSFAEYVLADPD